MPNHDYEEASDPASKMLEEVLALAALEEQFDKNPVDKPPTLAIIAAAEWVLTGARISIVLAEQQDGCSVAARDERGPHDDEMDDRDCLSRGAVEKMLTNVRIESAVITGEGNLSLLIKLRPEEDIGHVQAR
jgi:hypothetical protein